MVSTQKFDDLPTNLTNTPELSLYRLATYTNFYPTRRNLSNPIRPSSGSQYIRTDASGSGVLSITGSGSDYGDENFWWQPWGHLVSFRFACADPCTSSSSAKAVPCNVTVTATCVQVVLNYTASADPDPNSTDYYSYTPQRRDSTYTFSSTFAFSPSRNTGTINNPSPMSAVTSWSALEQGLNFPNGTVEVELQTFPQYTMNYTFVARQGDGRAAVLYLDDVVYNAWHSMG